MSIIEPKFQNAINEYFSQPEEDDYSKFINNLSNRNINSKFREEAAKADVAKYEQRNQAIRQDPQLYDRIQAKIQQLVERRDSDALSILDAINYNFPNCIAHTSSHSTLFFFGRPLLFFGAF